MVAVDVERFTQGAGDTGFTQGGEGGTRGKGAGLRQCCGGKAARDRCGQLPEHWEVGVGMGSGLGMGGGAVASCGSASRVPH